MHYVALSAQTNEGLTNIVNEWINKGYVPHGGVAVATVDGNFKTIYCQAMIKKV